MHCLTELDPAPPASSSDDTDIVDAANYPAMRTLLEPVHDTTHGFVAISGQHISFRDPFVFLLHSNVDRLFARWQTQAGHSDRVDPASSMALRALTWD